MLVALGIAALLTAIAIPSYRRYELRVKVSVAVTDILKIALAIQKYDIVSETLPPNLNAIGAGSMLDPWGHPYYYLPFTDVKGKGAFRKDKNLVPINSKYDLYSAGPDGATNAPLTAKASRDDIIRANDGGFIGIASDY